jgi:hypothetical protein
MNVEEAYRLVTRSSKLDVGRFYATGTNVGLGKGKIYKSVRVPIYSEQASKFDTREGIVYVLTHECDVDESNDRLFNTEVLICPIIQLADVVAEVQEEVSTEYLVSFLANLGARNIPRLIYLPPWSPQLPYGGIMYLNHISSTHVSAFAIEHAAPIAMLTAYGLMIVEHMIENHLLRPKVDPTALAG